MKINNFFFETAISVKKTNMLTSNSGIADNGEFRTMNIWIKIRPPTHFSSELLKQTLDTQLLCTHIAHSKMINDFGNYGINHTPKLEQYAIFSIFLKHIFNLLPHTTLFCPFFNHIK